MGARVEDEIPSKVCMSDTIIGCMFSSTPEEREDGAKGDGVDRLLLEDVPIADEVSLRGGGGGPHSVELGLGGGRATVSERRCVLPPNLSSSDNAGLERSCSIFEAAS